MVLAAANVPAAEEVPAQPAQASPEQREALLRAIDELQRRQQQTRAEKDSVGAELETLEKRIGELARRLRSIEKERKQLEQRQAALIEKKAAQQQRLDRVRQELATLVRGAYLAGREERLKLFLNQGDPALLNRILGYHDYLTRARSEKLKQLRQGVEELARLSAELQQQRRKLEELAVEYGEERQRLETRERERKQVLAQLEQQLRDEGERLRRMREDEQRLARIVEEAQAALQNLQLPEQHAFGERKGKLIWPLSGRLAVTFGTEKIGNLRWDGVIIRAPEGREVKAVHSGRVAYADKRVFDLVKDFGTSESPKSTRSSTTHWCPGRPGHPAFRHNIASSLRLHTGLPYDWTPRSDAPLGSPLAPSARRVSRVASRLPGTTRLRFALHGGQRWLRGYGLLTIIDHGDGYMTLYGHNQSLFKETGDWVGEGEVIGVAGRSGGLRRPGIYFGIRHKGKAVDPVRWCRRKRGRKVG